MNWMSTKYKLPEKEGKYLVLYECNKQPVVAMMYFCPVKDEGSDSTIIYGGGNTFIYATEYDEYLISKDILYWCEIPELPAHFRKCKDCSACHFTEYKGVNKQGETYKEGMWRCWGVSEPFEIKDINQRCSQY